MCLHFLFFRKVRCCVIAESSKAGLSKSAKKNAARRAKKATEGATESSGAASASAPAPQQGAQRGSAQQSSVDLGSAAQAAEAATQQMSAATIDGGCADVRQKPEAARPRDDGGAAPGDDSMESKQKRLRNLRKKVRTCQEQVEKAQAKGLQQSEELQMKVAHVPAWCAL
jgi:hypothetical protein